MATPIGPGETRAPTGDVSTVSGDDRSSALVTTMTKVLKAYTEAITAQTQATAAQHLRPLNPDSGEVKQVEDDRFSRWPEQFE